MRCHVEPSGVTLHNESLRFVRDTFETKGVLGGRIVTSRRSLRLTFSQPSLSQPTAIRCQGCEAFIDSGIVSMDSSNIRRQTRVKNSWRIHLSLQTRLGGLVWIKCGNPSGRLMV